MEDTDDRVPCSDDMCTGTLNEAGVCSYCGRSASGAPAAAAAAASFEAPEAVATGTSELDGDRIPCSDDMCTGTVNEKGVCNYCGRPYIRAV